MEARVSAGTCELGKEKEEINDYTINQKVPDKLSGQLQVCVIALCTQTRRDWEWFVQRLTPHSPQLPEAGFTGEKLFDKGHRSWPWFSTDFCETICSSQRKNMQDRSPGGECKVNMWVNWLEGVGGGVGGLWSPNIIKPALNCSTNTAVLCFCTLICQ